MSKTKCTELAERLGYGPKEMLERVKSLLKPEHYRGGKSAAFTWVTQDGIDLLMQAEDAPLTVAKRYNAYGLHNAANPRWMFCKLDGVEGKHPVALPRKLQGKLVGKRFMVEAIEDNTGITYRHELLGR